VEGTKKRRPRKRWRDEFEKGFNYTCNEIKTGRQWSGTVGNGGILHGSQGPQWTVGLGEDDTVDCGNCCRYSNIRKIY
jgi:hypothetical protein